MRTLSGGEWGTCAPPPLTEYLCPSGRGHVHFMVLCVYGVVSICEILRFDSNLDCPYSSFKPSEQQRFQTNILEEEVLRGLSVFLHVGFLEEK